MATRPQHTRRAIVAVGLLATTIGATWAATAATDGGQDDQDDVIDERLDVESPPVSIDLQPLTVLDPRATPTTAPLSQQDLLDAQD